MKKNLIKKIVLLSVIVSLMLFSQTVCASDNVAKGDIVYIKGGVTGSPQEGLAFWVFGPNYWTRETQSVTGNTYTYEISKSTTQNMASGQYFCIVQHPMYNGVFDADVSYDTPETGQTSVVSSAGNSFIIDGSGKLQGSAAANALMRMLTSPDIDDTYTSTEFYISEPWIRFTPKETYFIGDNLMISGQTNIADGEKLIYELYSASFEPTSKTTSSEFTGQSGTVTVIPGGDENSWEVPVDTSNLKPDFYIFKISKDDGSAEYTAEFTLAEAVTEKPAETQEEAEVTPFRTMPPATEATAENEGDDLKTTSQTPALGSGYFIFIALLSIFFVVSLIRRHS